MERRSRGGGIVIHAVAAFQREVQLRGGDLKKPGPNVTFEDFALLLRLIQLKNGGYPKKDGDGEPMVYDHLVIDEAQDFGAVELEVLLSSVRSRTGVTIVGDLNQRIVPDASFLGWNRVAEELGVEGAEVAKLEVRHRSSSGIIAAADAVAGTTTLGGFDGYHPELRLTEGWTESAQVIRDWATAVISESPSAHVCVVCRTPWQAQATLDGLKKTFASTAIDVREGHNKSFKFEPGITVTNANQIKGLEFDAVAVLDPTETAYPDDLDGRRLLYTVITRAKERLLFVSQLPLSPLVQRLRDDELVEEEDGAIPEFAEASDDEPFDAADAPVTEFQADEEEPF